MQQNDFVDIKTVQRKILDLKKEKAELCSQIDMRGIQILQKTLSVATNILSCVSSISSSLDSQVKYMESFDKRLKALESETRRTALDVKGLPASVSALEKNVEQVRNLSERNVQSSEKLSEDFIERHVKEPAMKDFGMLYNSIRQVSADSGNGVCKGLLKQARQLIEAQAVRVIEPKTGEDLNPKEHRPVKQVDTSLQDSDRKISRVFKAGLASNGRVIEHAVVEIYRYNQNLNKTEGEKNESAS